MTTTSCESRAYISLQAPTFGGAVRRGFQMALGEIIEAFKLIAQGFEESRGEVKAAFVRFPIYAVLGTSIFVGANIIREGGVVPGLHAAWNTSWFGDKKDNVLSDSQASLRAGVKSDAVIQTILGQILREAPYSSRVRLSLIHDGVTTITGVDLLRFDVTNAVAAPGRLAGDMVTNEPLSEWSPDYMPALLAHNCAVMSVDSLKNPARRSRLEAMGAAWILSCPVLDPYDQILGSVFINWDGNDKPPTGQALADLIGATKMYGRQIGSALDMKRLNN